MEWGGGGGLESIYQMTIIVLKMHLFDSVFYCMETLIFCIFMGVLRNVTKCGAPRGFGDLGRTAIYFRELGSTGNYFHGSGEQAHSFGDLGNPVKKQKINLKSHLKGKAFVLFIFFFFVKILRLLGGSPPDPLGKSKCTYLCANMLIWIGIGD